MKLKNILKLCFLSSLLVMLVLTGCKKDEPGLPPTADLETLIAEAENLIATSVEGTSPGDFKPGAIKELQDVLTWVNWAVANATSQSDLDKAAVRLHKYIEKFKTNTVALAIPIFNSTVQSYIKISDNILPELQTSAFTIEIETYYLGPGWVQNLISMEGDDGAPFGFTLRVFGGMLDLVIGNGGWAVGQSAGSFVIGEWVHYAITKDGNLWKVFMNGQEVISMDASPGMVVKSTPLTIGNGAFWGDRPWNGLVRDFRLWSVVRTTDELIANIDERLEGTEEGLKAYFPLDANLGEQFTDITGAYTATFVGAGVAWAPDGIPPVIELDYTALDAAVSNAEALKATVVEGENDGDYPVGTIAYIDALIAAAIEVREAADKQDPIDAMTEQLINNIDLIQVNLVADATGIYVDRENPNAVGLRITPNYTPQGDYTVEFDLKIKTLHMPTGNTSGEIFGNGSFGLRVYGYNVVTEEAIRNSGGVWNFTNWNNAWEGPTTEPLALQSMVWQHVAIVHDQTAMTTTIFVDGVELASQSDISFPLESGWGEIWLGNSWGDKMNGTIKDFRIWNAVKSVSELNAEIVGNEPDLHIYFPLDRVAGLSFADETGNYNAELRGVVWEK